MLTQTLTLSLTLTRTLTLTLTRYEVHAGWLQDSGPKAFTESYVRRSAQQVMRAAHTRAAAARVTGGGGALRVEMAGEAEAQDFDAAWLHALAPYVGRAVQGPSRRLEGPGYLLEALPRRAWGAGHAVARYEARRPG